MRTNFDFGPENLSVRWDTTIDATGRFKDVVQRVLQPIWSEFILAPASKKFHQAWEHGLLFHTLEVAEQVREMARFYQVDRELCEAAAVLHDVGKIKEYTPYVPPFFPVHQAPHDPYYRTEYGQKIGHVTESIMMTVAQCGGLSEDNKRELIHCIAAHHGRLEWGSPVEPKTKEAWLVHLVDMMNSRVAGETDRPSWAKKVD